MRRRALRSKDEHYCLLKIVKIFAAFVILLTPLALAVGAEDAVIFQSP